MINKTGDKNKNLWSTLKTISGDKSKKAINSIIANETLIEKPNEIAEALNNYFIKKVDDLIEKMPTPSEDLLAKLTAMPTPEEEQLQLMSITEQQLKEILKNMKKNTASGQDTINGIVLNDIQQAIIQILQHGINLSLATGIYPEVFKTAKLIPQVKIGKNPLLVENYRPISNLSTIGKIYEEAFFAQVSAFITKSGSINKDQHGGRAGHSTTTCLIELWEEAKKSLEAKEKVGLLALDMSAAYDLCDHKLLIQKCRLLNMGKNAVSYISHFLKGRSQYVELGGKESSTKKQAQMV